MSYSFNFTAASKSEAKDKAKAELDRVVEQQPIHRNDQAQALAAAQAFIDLVPEPEEGQVVYVNVNGSVGWKGVLGGDGAADISSAAVSVSASVSAAPRT